MLYLSKTVYFQYRYPDGEPISDDDKTFVLEKILNFHPDKETKLGSGVDFITVNSMLLYKFSFSSKAYLAICLM